MEKLFINIFQMSISASYLILAVLLVRFLLRKAPKSMRSFLWFLVGIRLLVPFSFESVFSLIPNTQAVDSYIRDIEQTEINTIAEATDLEMTAIQPIQSTYIVSSVEKNMSKTQIFAHLCAKIWLFGMVLMFGYMFISWGQLKKRVKMSVPIDIALNCGNVRIYRSDVIESPFLFGIISPHIYIPSHIASEELPYVIQHEMTHRKRKDYLIKPAAFLLLSVYWFSPCVWIAYIMLCKDIELICDEKVIQELGVSCKREYSQALLNNAVNHRIIAACPVAFGEVSVKERVKNVLNYKKPAFWLLVAAMLACIIVPVCFMTQKKSSASEKLELLAEEINLDDLIADEYVMFIPDQSEYIFVPQLFLGKDGKFTFGYDSFSSYISYGDYYLAENVLYANTDDGKYHYQFTCVDSLLIFDAEHSSYISQIDEANAPLENGSIFIKDSTLKALSDANDLSQTLYQERYQGTTVTNEEIQEQQILLAELQKKLTMEEMKLKRQLEKSEELQLTQDEITALEAKRQALLQELESSRKNLESNIAALQSMENAQIASKAIEQWAQAFCDRDGATIVKLADEKLEQKLVDNDILTHGFDGEKDYVSFGWSSPWPWGDNYDENVTAHNYRIVSVTDHSAEILYYAWVSDPHVTVWRETLTYEIENNECAITSETLQFKDAICVAEEFYQAYPDGITGTMMDYYSFNGAGEALNTNAKKNKDSIKTYTVLFEPDSAAIHLLNILDNPNKVGSQVTKSDTDPTTCTVSFKFYEDGSSVNVQMIQPYGSDGIWIPYSKSSGTSDDLTAQDTLTPSGAYIITDQNIDNVIEEDAKTLEALFPDHHEFTPLEGFSKNVDLNGDGIAEKIELTNLGYNGGDGGYALKVTDTKTKKQIPLPDGYTEETGFPAGTYYENPDGEEQPRLRIWLRDAKRNVTLATIMSDSLIRIYERKQQFNEVSDVALQKGSFGAQVDVISGCNIVTFNNEKTPTLVLKSYVSGCMGHIDCLGYVITELRLREDNTWDSKHYFLLDSCDDDKLLMQQKYESAGNGGLSKLPFGKDTDFSFLQLLPNE